MKYVILFFALLSSYSFAQTLNPEYDKNRYTAPGVGTVAELKSSTLHDNAKAAAIKCQCDVPFISSGYYRGSKLKSSSSKSSKASSSSVSSVQSSAQSSVASSSESSAQSSLGRIPLSFGRPVEREDGTPLAASEIKNYILERDSGFIKIESDNEKVVVDIDPPTANENLYLTTVDTDNVFSKRVLVEK